MIVDFNRCVTCCADAEDNDVPVSELRAIAQREEVAMVEFLVPA